LIHPHIRELSKPSLLKFERKGNERGCRSWNKLNWRRTRGLRGIMRNNLTLCRIRKIRTDAIKQRLHGGILYRRAQEDRRKFQRDCSTPDSCGELRVGWECIIQNNFGNFVIDFGELLDKFCAFLACNFENRCWDLLGFNDLDAMRMIASVRFYLSIEKEAAHPFVPLLYIAFHLTRSTTPSS
jgi:hypothetical protein